MSLPEPRPDSTVLITGASSGIGEALARELAGRGHNVSLVARRKGKLAALARTLRAEHGVQVAVHAADLAVDEDRRRLLGEVRSGRTVVGLCNNAGIGSFGHVLDHEPQEEDKLVRLNVLAVHELTVQLGRDMAARGEGAILNVASVLAFAPVPQNATYAATKAFVQSFSEALHSELMGKEVSCTAVFPGPTRTEIFDTSGAPGASGFGPGFVWQDPEQVAAAAVTAMISGRRSVVPGWTNKLVAIGYHLTPRTALLPLTRLAQSANVRRVLLGDGAAG
jgi:short-subunit dehydrogenase